MTRLVSRETFWFSGRMVAVGLCILAAVMLLSGCASRSDKILAGIIDEEINQANSNSPIADSAAPEPPSRALPPRIGKALVTIQPESIVEIRVEEDPALDAAYQVNGSSAIEFGYVGLVFLEDLTAEAAKAKISMTLKNRGFRTATVDVDIIKASYDKVRVSGAVMRPADVKIGPGSIVTLEEALRRAEGLRPQAQGARIKIVRAGVQKAFGIASAGEEYALVGPDGQPRVPDVQVSNNDWVHVFVSSADSGSSALLGEKEIMLLGEVNSPGIVRFTSGEQCTMLHLYIKVGGFPKWASLSSIRIMRENPDGEDEEIKVDIRDLVKQGDPDEDIALQNGDRIIVKERTLFF